jgi:hypothetical protein
MSNIRQNRSVDIASILGACGKKRYPHRRAAEEAMEAQITHAAERGESLMLRVYECPKSYCGGWHLTSAT